MSITLTTPFVITIGGVQVKNDTVGACTSVVTDFLARTQTTTFQIGTLVGNPPSLNGGPQGQIQNQTYVLTVHLDTSAWSDNHGHSGTVAPSILNPIVAQAISDRNARGLKSLGQRCKEYYAKLVQLAIHAMVS